MINFVVRRLGSSHGDQTGSSVSVGWCVYHVAYRQAIIMGFMDGVSLYRFRLFSRSSTTLSGAVLALGEVCHILDTAERRQSHVWT